MTNAEKEIRDILMGRTAMLQDGRLIVPEEGTFMLGTGVSDGGASLRFLGMTEKAQVLETRRAPYDVSVTIQKLMGSLGRGLVLQQQPAWTCACLIRYIATKPAVLTFTYRDGLPIVTAYAPKSAGGVMSVSRALKAFAEALPEDISVSEMEAPADDPEGKDAKKAAKKQEKQAKKEAKQAKKAEKQQVKDQKKQQQAEEKAREKAMENEDFWLVKAQADAEAQAEAPAQEQSDGPDNL